MCISTIKMNIHGVDVVKKLERHNEYLKFIAFLRGCAQFYIEAHHYIHDNICMLDYPPELRFDDFILQKENECFLERIEDPDLEKLICRKIAILIMDSIEKYKQRKATDVAAAFVGGYDIDSKIFAYVDYSQTPPKIIHEQLQEIVDLKVKEEKIAPVGQKNLMKKLIKKATLQVDVLNSMW